MLAPENNKQILIVDRDIGAVKPLQMRLSESGFLVRTTSDSGAAIAIAAERLPHLVIIDWNMPGFAGVEVIQSLRRIKTQQAMRLIILSELAAEQHVVSGLNLGADDYIAKPFSLREVVARVSVLLRSQAHESVRVTLSCDELVLDSQTNRVTARGRLVNLRGVEYRLLEFFMSNRGRTFNRSQLLSHVWGSYSEIDIRTVDVNIQRLRKILADQGYEAYIQTVRGFGYRFSSPMTAGAD